MSTIVTRYGKGSPLTWLEVDDNFTNLNTDKIQSGNTVAALTITSATINGGSINGTTVGASTASSGAFTTLSATGVTTVQAGTVSLPAITTTGDTNTGIFFPAADTIAFTEGGTEAMRINSSGQVGIGTASPQLRFHAVGGAGQVASFPTLSANSTAVFENNLNTKIALVNAGGAGVISTIQSYASGDTVPRAELQFASNTSSLNFLTANAERMRIDSSGNVGIGNTVASTIGTANAWPGLVVGSGTGPWGATIYSGATSNGGLAFANGTTTTATYNGYVSYNHNTNAMTFATNGGTERMRIDSTGNVGIGTTSVSNFGSNYRGLEVKGSDIGFIQASGGATSTTIEMMGAGNIGYLGTRTNHPLAFRTFDTERMRIDSSGNVGIGNTTPSSFDPTGKPLVVGSGSGNQGITIYAGTTGYSSVNFADGTSGSAAYAGQVSYDHTNNALLFNTNTGAERMRIDSSGNVLVGTTSTIAAKFSVKVANGGSAIETNNTSGTGNYNGALFYNNTNALCGYIAISGTTTSYATSSDYRLKENIAPMTGALDKITKLKPVTYTWKANGTNGQGFIAHELQEYFPDAVSGEKDAVNEDGKPVYQGVDTSFLVATLTTAIQEQQTIINDLKARIETLEGK